MNSILAVKLSMSGNLGKPDTLPHKDVNRACELLNYRWFQKKEWQDEIKRMLSSGLKYELDALANKDFQYLTKSDLPRKLKEKDWLD